MNTDHSKSRFSANESPPDLAGGFFLFRLHKAMYLFLYSLPIAILYKLMYNKDTVKETDSPTGRKGWTL